MSWKSILWRIFWLVLVKICIHSGCISSPRKKPVFIDIGLEFGGWIYSIKLVLVLDQWSIIKSSNKVIVNEERVICMLMRLWTLRRIESDATRAIGYPNSQWIHKSPMLCVKHTWGVVSRVNTLGFCSFKKIWVCKIKQCIYIYAHI